MSRTEAVIAVLVSFVWAGGVVVAEAAGPLFPAPLHLTRQVSDPFSGKTEVLDEYGSPRSTARPARTA